MVRISHYLLIEFLTFVNFKTRAKLIHICIKEGSKNSTLASAMCNPSPNVCINRIRIRGGLPVQCTYTSTNKIFHSCRTSIRSELASHQVKKRIFMKFSFPDEKKIKPKFQMDYNTISAFNCLLYDFQIEEKYNQMPR